MFVIIHYYTRGLYFFEPGFMSQPHEITLEVQDVNTMFFIVTLSILTVIAWVITIRAFKNTKKTGKISPNNWAMITAVVTTLTIMLMFIYSLM